jgi:hypothetical protein
VWKCLDRTWAVPGFRIGAGRIYDLACPKEGDKPPEVCGRTKRLVAERERLLRLLLLAGGAEMADMDMVDRLAEQQQQNRHQG